MGEYFHDHEVRKDFLNMTHKKHHHKGKDEHIQLLKNTLRKNERTVHKMKKMYAIYISDKGPECRICKELLQIKEKR